MSEKNEIIEKGKHEHENRKKKAEKLIYLYNIKQRAFNTSERSFDIISTEVKNVSSEITSELPKISSIKRNIIRSRQEIGNMNEIEFDDIPDSLKKGKNSNLFLRIDTSVKDENRILIFSNENKFEYIDKIQIFIIDGTFKSCPYGFYQVLVIHGYFLGSSFFIFYCVLNFKTQEIYEKCFNLCLTMKKFDPKYIILDFEKSLS